MTSFYPTVMQDYNALRQAVPPTLELLRTQHAGTRWERLWLGMPGSTVRGLCVERGFEAGVTLIRFVNDDPNPVIQALANHWGCAIQGENGERFEPTAG